MSDIAAIMKDLKKKHGDEVMNQGAKLQNSERIPTGWFDFDLACGGGLPLGRINILYGAESSLKTTLALRVVAAYQRKYPKKKCVFVDIENHYDPIWGKKLGVNNDNLIYVMPDHAEQVVDIVQSLLEASDIGIIVLDSLAALITTNEANSSADKAVVGGAGLVVGKLYRKITLGLSRARKEGRHPMVIAINQIRLKVGVLYGDPETMPGGNAFKFASSLTIRLYGKDEVVSKVNATMPSYKLVSGIIKKYKVPITARTFEFRMGALNSAINGIKLAHVEDWKTVYQYLQELGWAVKKGHKVTFLDEVYPTALDLKRKLQGDLPYYEQLKAAIIKAVLEANAIEDASDDEEEDDTDHTEDAEATDDTEDAEDAEA